MTRVAVTGATGRMGRTVIEAAEDRDDVEVVMAINRDPDTERVGGHRVHPASDLRRMIRERSPEVVVDFTGPYSAVRYAETCAQTGVAFVSGTTGIDNGHEERLRDVAESVPVLHAANFARGVGVLRDVLQEAVAALPGYDVEVVETHHRGKRDAPSGTARDLLSAVEDASGGERERRHGRHGESPREDGEIGVHSLRAGSVTGSHAVVIAGEGEHLRLEHRAGDRSAFAGGALQAAAWIAGRPPGWYELSDVGGGE
ncbi:4-hydroxy-tetrahydrodipicolinate reductase [Halobacteriales archaeon QS_8_69_26]|nr:MAG: 4-hydroxy-tetrahydrodipicolinate reductase [Halobacteriales archaeon QS_8_69_26]